MPDQANDKRSHFVLAGTSEARSFTSHNPKGGSHIAPPELPRERHGATLLAQLQQLRPVAAAAVEHQRNAELESGFGLQIQFRSQPDVELAFESLQNENAKIELLNVRSDAEHTYATVFVPDGKLDHFEKYIAEYLQEKKNKRGDPIDHKNLLNTIESIRAAEINALWTDDPELLPDDDEPIWWEVWLPVRDNRDDVVEDFKKLAGGVGFEVAPERADFPERSVMLMFGTKNQLSRSVMVLNCVAELRRAKETADFFDSFAANEQLEWQDELLARSTFVNDTDEVPRICLLDTGVNRGHPLISGSLDTDDLHTINAAWGADDDIGHGTGLAGLAVFGDLKDALASDEHIEILHRLESVKLLNQNGGNVGNNEHHAHLFAEAVSHPEIAAPNRRRVFSSAITATDARDRGRPSSWSAMVDSLASDADNNGEFPRLIVLSGGNINDTHAWSAYPASLSTNLIHDPGQAWNALTVGAFTELVDISETDADGLSPVAPAGGLSPYSTTSASWEPYWPLKPDVVFEGGNVYKDELGAAQIASLSLLTTHHQLVQRLFTTSCATSAASALCARMAAQLMAAYPKLRTETIRALIVHSAEWTDAMRQLYLPQNGATKTDYVNLVRHCGYGVPNLDRALWSASNSLTLIVEDSVHPYRKDDGKIKTRDMNVHELPWPKNELEALGDTQVEMRVTLSYFIEPNPSSRGGASKFHYASHRLRFDVRRSTELLADFIARVNAASEEGDGKAGAKDPNWRFGDSNRRKGSLHSDVWTGTATDLASRGFLAIYPAMGWWRTRPKLARYDLPARYSLIVSIHTPVTEIDIYQAVANQVQTEAAIEIRG
jgi:hypothetical protein